MLYEVITLILGTVVAVSIIILGSFVYNMQKRQFLNSTDAFIKQQTEDIAEVMRVVITSYSIHYTKLYEQYLDGNKASLDTLINKHKSKVFSYILMVVKNRELAEDIFQDAFIKVIRSLHAGKYNDEGRFVSWVMRIAHNLIIVV